MGRVLCLEVLRRARRRAAAGAIVVTVTSLAACGISMRSKTEPVVFAALNSCLEKHGIARPENTARPTQEELAIPRLIGLGGMRVPIGVTRAQLEGALKQCGADFIHVAPAPVTSAVLQHGIVELRTCLANNGFSLPPPNFSGGAPALDTHGIAVASARWVATVRGCETTPRLTQSALTRCMGARTLEGAAKTNSSFGQHFLELTHCLRSLR